MRTLSKGFSLIPVTALALALMLSAAPTSAQSTQGAATDRTATSSERRDDLAGKLVRRIIQRAPSWIPGREIVQVETEIPAGVESGWHVHPGEEVGYIIAGEVEMKVEGRPTVILRAGDGFLIPPRTRTMRATLVRRRGGCCRPISSSKASRSRRSSGSMSRSSRHFPIQFRGGFSVASCRAAAVRFYEHSSQIYRLEPQRIPVTVLRAAPGRRSHLDIADETVRAEPGGFAQQR